MARRKLKSIYDNVSLEGLESFYEQTEKQDLDSVPDIEPERNEKRNAIQTLRAKEATTFNDILADGFIDRLKLKTTRKAVSEFIENLPSGLHGRVSTLFEKDSERKAKGKTKERIREIVKIVVVQEEQNENIAYLEDRSKTIIDVVPEEETAKKISSFKSMEDELTSAYCKIEILKAKEKELYKKLEDLENTCIEKDQEVVWLKSQNDEISATLHGFQQSFWWKVRNWFSGS